MMYYIHPIYISYYILYIIYIYIYIYIYQIKRLHNVTTKDHDSDEKPFDKKLTVNNIINI